MTQRISQQVPGVVIKTITFRVSANITATTDPLLRFIARENFKPLSFRIDPITEFDFTTGDETYTLSVEKNGTSVSTANTAISASNKTSTAEATFADTVTFSEGDVCELIVTLGGSTPIIPAGSLVTFEYAVIV